MTPNSTPISSRVSGFWPSSPNLAPMMRVSRSSRLSSRSESWLCMFLLCRADDGSSAFSSPMISL